MQNSVYLSELAELYFSKYKNSADVETKLTVSLIFISI